MSKEGGDENHRINEAHDCYVRLDIRVKWVEEASRNYMTFIQHVMQYCPVKTLPEKSNSDRRAQSRIYAVPFREFK